MKKIVGIFLVMGLSMSFGFSQSLLKSLSDTAKSVKNSADAVKNLSDNSKKSSKKKVKEEVQEEKPEFETLYSEDALYIYLNLTDTPLTDSLSLDYAKSIEEDVYDKYKNDEFEWNDKFETIKKNFAAKVENAKVDNIFGFTLDMEFGDYDFSKEAYSIKINPGTFIPLDSVGNWGCKTNEFNSRIGLKLKDIEKYNLLKMSKDEAKTFLQSRKNSYGDVNRTVRVFYKFEIGSLNSSAYKEWEKIASSNGYLPLIGEILETKVLDVKNNYKELGTLTAE